MTQTAEPLPSRTAYDEWRDRRWRLTGLAVAVVWLVTAVAFGVAGEKRSDLGTLVDGIRDGSVTEVRVVGLVHGAPVPRREHVILEWRGTVLARFAEVDVVRRPLANPGGDTITGDPGEHLRSVDPSVQVSYGGMDHLWSEWRGWRASEAVALLALASWAATLFLVASGPEPLRATRWAWGWFVLLGGPLGSLAYLLLGGALDLRRPADPNRRLTGGWAFLIAIVLSGGAASR
jgi:hypothetical protein